MTREIQMHQELDVSSGRRSFGRLRFVLGFWLFELSPLSISGSLASIKLELKFLVQPERLPPTFQFVARVLRCLFICAEIKYKESIVHLASLRRARRQVKSRGWR